MWCYVIYRYASYILNMVVSLMASFVLSFFPLDVFGEIRDLIESVSEEFLTYCCISELLCLCCVEILKITPYIYFML